MIDCDRCERRCSIAPGSSGYCRMYLNRAGNLEPAYPDQVSLLMVSRIESLPVFHFWPGSRTLVFATGACNLDCHYCSNAYLARNDPSEVYWMKIEPGLLLRRARQAGCHNLAFAMNEPTVSLEYYEAVSVEARAAGLPIGCLTNGYQTPEAAVRLAEASDFINLSVKGFSDAFYRDYADAPQGLDPVLRNLEFFHENTHLEVTTPIVAGLNDDDIVPFAEWLGKLDDCLPWHVFRLLPEYKMADRQYPDISQLELRLREAGRHLRHVYFGNFAGSRWLTTCCPSCGREVIERVGLGGCGVKPLTFALESGRCPACGSTVRIVGDWVDWHSAETEEAV